MGASTPPAPPGPRPIVLDWGGLWRAVLLTLATAGGLLQPERLRARALLPWTGIQEQRPKNPALGRTLAQTRTRMGMDLSTPSQDANLFRWTPLAQPVSFGVMALLGEEIVEEWLNRQGYFTIRGIKLGNDEIDILAIRPLPNGKHECRHIEVTISINPISYITKVPSAIRKATGIGAHNAKKRDVTQLKQGVHEWIEAKFNLPRKVEMKNRLCPGSWTKELVVGSVKHEEELDLLRQAGITIHSLKDVLSEMIEKPTVLRAAAGADLFDLMLLRK